MVLGVIALALIIGGLQYNQHLTEERILRGSIKLEQMTEFQPASPHHDSQSSPSTQPGANMSARITRLERALAWLEAQSSPRAGNGAAPMPLSRPQLPLPETKIVVDTSLPHARSSDRKKPAIDRKSSTKLKHLRHQKSGSSGGGLLTLTKAKHDDSKQKKHASTHMHEFAAETEVVPNVLLERILDTVGVRDVTNYPSWYFGSMGARGYFEHGPWAARADLNITNENHCGKSRKNVGPWPKLISTEPAAGRRALVATVSRCAICDFIGPWEKFGSPLMRNGVVLVGGGNENWGMFSESVTNRSVQWGVFENKLKGCGKTLQDFHNFMNDPRILLWVTNQHHALKAVHPKILSLPLGMKNKPDRIFFEGMKKYAGVTKKKLLIINNSGWKHREQVNALVAAKFPYLRDVGNMYAVGKDKKKTKKDYYEQLAEAKFVLCPSGMG